MIKYFVILITVFFTILLAQQDTSQEQPKKCAGQKTAVLNDSTIVDGNLRLSINIRSPISITAHFEDDKKHSYHFNEINKIECENGKVMSPKKLKFWRYYFVAVNTLLAYLFLTNYKA